MLRFAWKQRSQICLSNTVIPILHASVFHAISTSCRKTGSVLFVEFISFIDVHLMTHLFSVTLSINIFLFYSFLTVIYIAGCLM